MSVTIKAGQSPTCPKCGGPMVWVDKLGIKVVKDFVCCHCGYNPSGGWAMEKRIK